MLDRRTNVHHPELPGRKTAELRHEALSTSPAVSDETHLPYFTAKLCDEVMSTLAQDRISARHLESFVPIKNVPSGAAPNHRPFGTNSPAVLCVNWLSL